jgi:hypothetical protein
MHVLTQTENLLYRSQIFYHHAKKKKKKLFLLVKASE